MATAMRGADMRGDGSVRPPFGRLEAAPRKEQKVSSVRNKIGLLMACVTLAALTAAPVLAGPGGSGRLTTSIALDGATLARTSSSGWMVSGAATFQVTRSYAYDKETIWVTNKCYDAAGSLVSRRDAVVLWGTNGSLVGTTGAMPTTGARCSAYVTMKPWADRPMGDALEYWVAS